MVKQKKRCEYCSKVFKRGLNVQENYWAAKKYCSDRCAYIGPPVTIKCQECSQQFEVNRKQKNTKFCSNICLRKSIKKRPKKICKYEDSLAAKFPEVAKHWSEKKNGFPATEVSSASNDKFWFSCGNKHHDHFVILSNKIKAKNICPYCSGRYATAENNLAVRYPKIAAEWHPTKNKKEPHEVTYGAAYNAWWQCKKGHEWQISVNSRTNMGSACGKCNNQSSRNEIRILTELMKVYDGIISRDRSYGAEADILVTCQKVVIEFDGWHWHKDKVAQDKTKNAIFIQQGLKVIRIREQPLVKLASHDLIIHQDKLIEKKHIDHLLQTIDAQSEKAGSYLSHDKFLNEELYRTYLDYFPSPFPEHSFAENSPRIAREWHPTKNRPLTPQNFTKKAGYLAWWQCKDDPTHEWQQTIHARVGMKLKCPTCFSLSVNYPEISKLWHPTKNKDVLPLHVKSRSGLKFWWQCKDDPTHEWKERPFDMVKVTENFCLECVNEFSAHIARLRSEGYSTGILSNFFNVKVSNINNFSKNLDRKRRTSVVIPRKPWGIPENRKIQTSHLPSCSKPLETSLGYFPSMSHAARAVGLESKVVAYRLGVGWTMDQALGLAPARKQKFSGKSITVDGKEFSSISAAAREYGKDSSWVSKKIRNGATPDEVFNIVK